ncbi:transmembrane amino acid transporter protein-domain-containing protein [Auriculariales sp. MPI-PUGE-AT-0066]|nr:transmembrane amino acid transporter protein-domain-containing protein [Auriculariales sp. MPI-PUGE-AT-0066]
MTAAAAEIRPAITAITQHFSFARLNAPVVAWLSGILGARSRSPSANYVDYIPLETQQVSRDSPLTPTLVAAAYRRDSEDSMVSYGSTGDNDDGHAEATNGNGDQRAPLLARANGAEERAHTEGVELDANGRRQGKAAASSGIGNLANTIIGSGMLSFPLAMASAGIIPGLFTCLFSGGMAAFGLYLLSRCATRAPHRHASFFAISQLTYPKAAVFFDAAIAIKCFGVSISYLIIIKGLMPSVVASIYHVLTPEGHNPPAWALDGRLWIGLFSSVLVPLCFLRNLNSLRHTSYVALFSVAYLVTVVIVCFVHPPKGAEEPGEIHLIHFTPSFVSTFPVQVFAFTCAQNLFPVYNELWSNTQERMTMVIGTSIGSAIGVYEVVAVLGYLTFGSKVGPNIIANYPNTSLFIAGAQLAIVINVLCSYPLQVHPCRNCLDKVFHSPSIPADHVHRVQSADEPEVEDEFAPDVMSTWKHSVLTAGIVCAGYAIAFIVDDLTLVFGFVGSTGSTTISFILPGLFYFKLFKDEPDEYRWVRPASLALMIYGILVMIFCLSFNIYSVMHPAGSAPAEIVRRYVLQSVM